MKQCNTFKYTVAFLMLIALSGMGGVWGATYEWSGAVNNNWADVGNWNPVPNTEPVGVPGIGDAAVINTAVTINTGSAVTVQSLTIDGGVSVTLGGGLTVSGDVTLNAGTLVLADVAGQTIGGNVTGTGTLDASAILSGHNLTVTGNIGVPAGTALVTLIAPAGTLNVGGGWNVTNLISNGTINTGGGDLSFTAPVVINENSEINSGGGNIVFSSSVTGTTVGGQTLSLNAGTGAVLFTGAVGGTQLGALTVHSASAGVTASSTINASSVSLTGGDVVLLGDVTAPGGFSSTGANFNNTGASITTTDTALTINHTGSVTIGSALASGTGNIAIDSGGLTSITSAGAITTTTGTVTFGATGTLQTAGNITTAGGNIFFTQAVTLTNAVALSTGGGAGNITFNSTLTGVAGNTDTLELTAGTGVVLFSGIVGDTPLGSLTVNSASAATFSANVTTTLEQHITATAISISGTHTTIASPIHLTGALTLASDSVLNSTDGAVTLSSTVQATAAETQGLEINSGAGLISITGPVGSPNLKHLRLNSKNATGVALPLIGSVTLQVFSGGPVIQSAVLTGTNLWVRTLNDAGSAITLPLANNFTGVTLETLNAAASTDGAGAITYYDSTGFELGPTAFASFDNAGIRTTSTTTLSSGGAITQDGQVISSGLQLIGTGPVTLAHAQNNIVTLAGSLSVNLAGLRYNDINAFTVGSVTTVGITTHNGAVELTSSAIGGDITIAQPITTGTGSVTINSFAGEEIFISHETAVTTTGGTITFHDPVVLTLGTTLSTGGGAGNITFNSTLTGVVGNTDTLELTAGTGSVVFTDAVGVESLGSLTVHSASAGITASSTINANTVILTGGNVLLGGTVVAPGGFSSTGVNFNNTGASITTTDTALTINHTGSVTIGSALASGTGNIAIDSGGLTSITSAGAITTTTGTVTFGATGTLQTAGNITTAGGNIFFTQAVTLTNAVALSTGAGVAGNITFSSTLTGVVGNTDTLELTAGTGSVVFTDAVGAESLGSLTVNSASAATFSANVTTTLEQHITATAISINGTHTTTASPIYLIGALTLASDSVLNSTDGAVTLSSTVQATAAETQGLEINSGAGLISITGPVGSPNLKHLRLNSKNATGVALPLIGSVTLQVFSGGPVIQSAVLTGTNLWVRTLNDAGSAITLPLANNFTGVTLETLNAAASTDGAGAITYYDSTGFELGPTAFASFDNAGIRTTSTTTLSSGGAITQDGQVISSGLRLIGTGPVTLAHAQNNIVTLAGNLSVNLAGLRYNDINAFTVGSVTTVGITTHNGAVELTSSAIGGDITIAQPITTGTGSVTINSFAGEEIFISHETAVTTTGGTITFHDPVVLTLGTALSTGGGAGNITFNSTLTGVAGNTDTLELTAGTGVVLFSGIVGDTPLGSLTVNSASAATFSANVTTTLEQHITATAISISGTHTTIASPIHLTGALTLASDSVLNSTDGAVTLSSTVQATAAETQGLEINSGAGLISITGPVGSPNLKHLRLNSKNATGVALPLIGSVTLQVFSGGPVIQSAVLTGTNLWVRTLNDAGSAITLPLANNFTGVTLETLNAAASTDGAGAITYYDSTGFELGPTAFASFDNAGIRTTSTTTLSSGGAITQDGQVISSGLRLIGTGPVTLAHAQNNIVTLAGNLSVNLAGLRYNDINAFTVGSVTTVGITTHNGAVELTSSAIGGDITIAQPITTGTGSVTINSFAGEEIFISHETAVTTTGGTITFHDPVVLTLGTALSTGGGAGNITFNSTLTGVAGNTDTLELTAGTGVVLFSGIVGDTPLGSLTVNSASAATFSANVTTTLEQHITATAISISGTHTTIASPIHLTGALTLASDSVLNSTDGAVTLSSTVQATAAETQGLEINSGAGLISITGPVGSPNLKHLRLNSKNATGVALPLIGSVTLQVFSGGPVIQSAVLTGTNLWVRTLNDAGSAITLPLANNFTGVTLETLNAAASTDGAGAITYYDSTGFELGPTAFASFDNAGIRTTSTTTLSSGGAITQDGQVISSGLQLIGTGPVTLAHAQNNIVTLAGSLSVNLAGLRYNDINAFTVGSVTTVGITTHNGAVELTSSAIGGDITIAQPITTGTGSVTINSFAGEEIFISHETAVTTTGGTITFHDPVVLTLGTTLSTGGGAGNITFNSTLTGVVGNTDTLELTAGTGSVVFTDAVGVESLGSLTVHSASAGITASSTINANTVILTGGNVLLGGTVVAPGGFSSTGVNFNNTGASITTTDTALTINHTGSVTIGSALASGTGNIAIDSGGLTSITSAGAITTTTGTVTFGATGTLQTAGNITTAGGNIFFTQAVTLTNAVALSTGAGVAGNITFSSTLTGVVGNTDTLELTAGTGSVVFTDAVGAESLGSLTVNSASAATFSANVTTTLEQHITATAISINGTHTTTASPIYLIGALTLASDSVLNSTDGAVTLSSTVQATAAETQGLEINSGAGLISITGPVGSPNLKHLRLNSKNATGVALPLIGSVTLQVFSGGPVIQSAVLTGTNLWVRTLNDAGSAITLPLANNFTGVTLETLNAAASTDGAGAITYYDSTGFELGPTAFASFDNAGIRTTSTTTLSSGGAITQDGQVISSGLQLIGTGPVTLAHAQNNIVTLAGSLSVNLAGLRYNDINAFTVGSVTTVGITTHNGAVELTSSAIGGDITIAQPITTGTGSVTINSFAGEEIFISHETAVTTTGGTITFHDPVVLTLGTALSTGGGAGNITFNSTLTGVAGNTDTLELTAGTGVVLFSGIVGDTPLGSLTVNSASAATFSANVTTTLEQHITATAISISGTHTTIASPIHLIGALTLASDSVLNSTDGAVTLSSTVQATAAETQGLEINSGAGLISITGPVGSPNLKHLRLNSKNATGVALPLIGSVTLQVFSGGPVIQSAVLTGTNLWVRTLNDAGSAITLPLANNFTGVTLETLNAAASTDGAGAITYYDSTGFELGPTAFASFDNAGIRTTSTTTLSSGGAITQDGQVISSGLRLIGTGPVTLAHAQNNIVTLAGSLSVNLAGLRYNDINAFTVGSVTTVGITTNNGAVELTSSAIGGDITIAQPITTGTGSVTINSFAGEEIFISHETAVTTTGGTITFHDPVVLTLGTALSTGAGVAGNIVFGALSTINGPFDLTINAGAGKINFGAALGAITPVGDGTGSSIIAISSHADLDAISFASTVRSQDGLSLTGNVTACNNITVLGGTTPSEFTTGTLTLSLNPVVFTRTGTGALTFNAKVEGNQNLILNVEGTTAFNKPVGGILPAAGLGSANGPSITINSSGPTIFGTSATVHTATGISQANTAGEISFGANVTVASAETPSTFLSGLAFVPPTGSLVFESAGNIIFGSAAPATPDAITVTGSAGQTITFRTTNPASGQISLNSTLNSNLNLRIENAGFFRTNENADIILTGTSSFQQVRPASPIATITDNRVMLAGGIVSAGGNISFASDAFLFGTTVDMRLESTGNSTNDSIFFAKDLHIIAGNTTVNKTVFIGSPLQTTGNFVLYNGILDFADTTARRALSVGKDLVLLNGDPATMYDDNVSSDAFSGVSNLFAYLHPARSVLTAASNVLDLQTSFPDETVFPANYTGEINGTNLAGKTLATDSNFYANGVNLVGADPANPWTISIPDNNNATAAFAEMYNLTVANSTVEVKGVAATGNFFAWVSAAENCIDGGGNTEAAISTADLTVSSGVSFSRPYFMAENTSIATAASSSGTYTVFDDVIRVEFRNKDGTPRRIENSNEEISKAILNETISFNHNGTTRVAFTGVFKDPACTILTTDKTTPNEKGELIDLSVFYLRTNPAVETQRWNTDATGISPGDTDPANGTTSTDRGRNADELYAANPPTMRTSIPDIEIHKATDALYQTLRDEHKNRIGQYTGDSVNAAVASALPGARFTATGDRCRPVLVEVKVGQELHVDDPKTNAVNYFAWDAHNYFELRWSEPVTIGDLTDTGALSENVRSTHDFDASTQRGGAMKEVGANLAVSGYFTAIPESSSKPLTWKDGTRNLVSTPGNPDDALTANSLYRSFALDSTKAALESGSLAQPAHPHRLRIYLAGYADPLPPNASAWKWFWPGYIDDISDPVGASVKSVANALIRDKPGSPAASTNAVEPYSDDDLRYGQAAELAMVVKNTNKADVSVTAHTVDGIARSWDTIHPDVAAFRTKNGWDDEQTTYEASPVDTSGDGFMDRIEFHVFDDKPIYESSAEWQWVSARGWYAGIGREESDLKLPVPDSRGGMRSSSTFSGFAGDGSFLSSAKGFSFIDSTSRPDILSLTNEQSANFGTTVTGAIFNPEGVISQIDDGYLAVFLDGLKWRMVEQMWYAYDNSVNYITDLAGLRLKSHGPRECKNTTPPDFTFTIQPMATPGVEGYTDNKLYILFSKRVNKEGLENNLHVYDSAGIDLIDPSHAVFYPHPDPDPKRKDVTWDAIITLTRPLTLEEIQTLRVTPKTYFEKEEESGVTLEVSGIQDEQFNRMISTASHRITDIGVNLAIPLYASEGINTDGTFGEGQGALRVFDGTGRLLDRDITISTQINTGPGAASNDPAGSSMQLYYDVNPNPLTFPALYNDLFSESLKLWLPSIVPSFNSAANIEARSLTPEVSRDNGRIRNFIVPSSDPEIETGAKVEFLFKYGDLFCARLTDPMNILSVDPWRFSISALKAQRGGVTILNNVIDSLKREKTLLTVEMPKSGNLVIHVFTMDGNIVRTLERNKKGAGTYTYTWDGSNLAGNPVARGMYFIRVVGPDMDEIRKVMVVKE